MHLDNNDLSGSIPASFLGLRNVSELYLQDNALDGPLPDSIGKLANLQYLWVGNNAGLYGPVPTGMTSLQNADIPAAVVRPGLEMVIEVDPDGTLDPNLGIPARIPATGRMAVDVADLVDLQLTLIPFLYEADPDSSILETTAGMAEDPDEHPMFAETRTFLPIGGWDIKLHDPVVSSTDNGFTILRETEMMRLMEGRPGYWLSMLAPVRAFGLFGVAYNIPSWSSFSIPLAPTVARERGSAPDAYGGHRRVRDEDPIRPHVQPGDSAVRAPPYDNRACHNVKRS